MSYDRDSASDRDPNAQEAEQRDDRLMNASKDTDIDSPYVFNSFQHHGDSRAEAPSKVFSRAWGMSAAAANTIFVENFVSRMFSVTKVGVGMFLYLLADLCYTRYSASSFDLFYVRLFLATGIASSVMFLPKLVALALHGHSHSLRAASESEIFYPFGFCIMLFFPFLIVPLSDAAVRVLSPFFVPFLDAEWFIYSFPIDKASSTALILGFSCTLPALNAICMVSFTALNLQMRAANLAYHLTFVSFLLTELQTLSLELIIMHQIAIFMSAVEWPALQERVISLFALFSDALSTEVYALEREIPCRRGPNAASPVLAALAAVFVGTRCNCYLQLSKMLQLSAHFVVVSCVLSITNVCFYLFDMHSSAMLLYPLSFFCMAGFHSAPTIFLVLFGSIGKQKKCLCGRISVPYFWSIVSIFIIIICRFLPLIFNSMLAYAAPFELRHPLDRLLPILLSAYLSYALLSFNPAVLRPVGWIAFYIFTHFVSLYFLTPIIISNNIDFCLRITMVNLIGVLFLYERICSRERIVKGKVTSQMYWGLQAQSTAAMFHASPMQNQSTQAKRA